MSYGMTEYESTKVELVAHAATILDKVRPGWEKRVDLERLDMLSCRDCILGQVFASIWHKPWTWTPLPFSKGERVMERAGVVVFGEGVFACFENLWIAEIERRRQ